MKHFLDFLKIKTSLKCERKFDSLKGYISVIDKYYSIA